MTPREKYNRAVLERVEVDAMMRDASPEVAERVKRRLAIEYGLLMGVLFRLNEKHGARVEHHPRVVQDEVAKLGLSHFPRRS